MPCKTQNSKLMEDNGTIKINPNYPDILLPPNTRHRISFDHLNKKKSTSALQKSLYLVDAKNPFPKQELFYQQKLFLLPLQTPYKQHITPQRQLFHKLINTSPNTPNSNSMWLRKTKEEAIPSLSSPRAHDITTGLQSIYLEVVPEGHPWSMTWERPNNPCVQN